MTENKNELKNPYQEECMTCTIRTFSASENDKNRAYSAAHGMPRTPAYKNEYCGTVPA